MNEMTVSMVSLGLVVLLALPTSAHGEDAGERGVSLIQLIANPTSFDGRRVAVTGYVVLEFEHTAVYLHETDATYGIARNGLWLDVPVGGDSHRARVHRRYVSIEGTFSAQR